MTVFISISISSAGCTNGPKTFMVAHGDHAHTLPDCVGTRARSHNQHAQQATAAIPSATPHSSHSFTLSRTTHILFLMQCLKYNV